MPEIKLIIFDLDGTLIDSKEDIIRAVNFTLKDRGLKAKPPEEISSYIGTGVEDLVRKSLGEDGDTIFEEAFPIFEDYYRRHSADHSVLFPNVKEVLEYFKEKRKMIITNKKSELAVITLKALNIYGYFESVMGGDDAGCMKPSACPLDKAIRGFDISDKAKVIMVGDMAIDVTAGKSAGVKTCAVTYGIGKREDIIKAAPDYLIDDLIELKRIIV